MPRIVKGGNEFLLLGQRIEEIALAEIGPFRVGGATERAAIGRGGGDHEAIVVRERRDELAGKARRNHNDAVLDAGGGERGRELPWRDVAETPPVEPQRDAGSRAPVR